MPDVYSINGVAAPEDTAEDCAAWLRCLGPASLPDEQAAWVHWSAWRAGAGLDLPDGLDPHPQP